MSRSFATTSVAAVLSVVVPAAFFCTMSTCHVPSFGKFGDTEQPVLALTVEPVLVNVQKYVAPGLAAAAGDEHASNVIFHDAGFTYAGSRLSLRTPSLSVSR